LPRAASISRQLLLRLPEKPPPSSLSRSLATSVSSLPRAPKRDQAPLDHRSNLRAVFRRERSLVVLLGFEHGLFRVRAQRGRHRLFRTLATGEQRRGDLPCARRVAYL